MVERDDELGRLLAAFGDYQRRRNLSPLTMKNRRFRVRAVDVWLQAHHSTGVLEATGELIEEWLDSTGVQAQTRYSYIAYLAAFYRWAVREGVTTTDPTLTIDRPKLPRRLPRPVHDRGLEDALRFADLRMRAWLCLGAYQGFRCIEIARLLGEDIDRHRETITARGKGNKERTLGLHPETFDALRAYGLPLRGRDLVFERRGGGPIHPSTVSRYISRHLADTGTAHQLRHWFGTEFYEKSGGDILLTQQAMGHASAATTAIYAEVNATRGKAVISRLGVGRRSA